jgi:hypothetical protein
MAKLIVENYDIKITIEKDLNDIDIFEWFEMFKSAMIGITFPEEVINKMIKENAESCD